MRVGVTGATGLLGSHLLPALLEAGHDVTGLARERAGRELAEAERLEWLAGDLRDERALGRLASTCDAVVHAAYDPSEEHFVESNLVGPVRLFEACAQSGAQFVLVSSLSVYGDDLTLDPLGAHSKRDVDFPVWPRELYGAHKAALEKLVYAGAVSLGTNASIFRLGWVLGVRDEWSRNALAPFVEEALGAGCLSTRKAGFVLSVNDAARVLASAVGDDELRGTRWNVFDRWMDFAELAPMLGELLGGSVAVASEPCPLPENPVEAGDLHERFGPFATETHVRGMLEQLIARRRESAS